MTITAFPQITFSKISVTANQAHCQTILALRTSNININHMRTDSVFQLMECWNRFRVTMLSKAGLQAQRPVCHCTRTFCYTEILT